MKAVVEFEVNNCNDCAMRNLDVFERNVCGYPKLKYGESITDYIVNDTYPDWCPIFKEKNE